MRLAAAQASLKTGSSCPEDVFSLVKFGYMLPQELQPGCKACIDGGIAQVGKNLDRLQLKPKVVASKRKGSRGADKATKAALAMFACE